MLHRLRECWLVLIVFGCILTIAKFHHTSLITLANVCQILSFKISEHTVGELAISFAFNWVRRWPVVFDIIYLLHGFVEYSIMIGQFRHSTVEFTVTLYSMT